MRKNILVYQKVGKKIFIKLVLMTSSKMTSSTETLITRAPLFYFIATALSPLCFFLTN